MNNTIKRTNCVTANSPGAHSVSAFVWVRTRNRTISFVIFYLAVLRRRCKGTDRSLYNCPQRPSKLKYLIPTGRWQKCSTWTSPNLVSSSRLPRPGMRTKFRESILRARLFRPPPPLAVFSSSLSREQWRVEIRERSLYKNVPVGNSDGVPKTVRSDISYGCEQLRSLRENYVRDVPVTIHVSSPPPRTVGPHVTIELGTWKKCRILFGEAGGGNNV